MRGLAILFLLAGCATSSGPMALGGGRYTIDVTRSRVLGGGRAARQAGIQEANAFCDAKGQEALVTSAIGVDRGGEVDFRCVPAGTQLVRQPDTIIEIRNR